jgi:hypothetical protein
MSKIIKAAEVQRRRRERAKAKQVAERRECANNTLAIAIRLEKGFDKVITDVLVGQDPDLSLTVFHAVIPAICKILLTRMSSDGVDLLIERLRSRSLTRI